MRRHLPVAAIAAFVGAFAGPALAETGPAYTSAQASSGKAFFDRNCASCHGTSLEGTNDAPALKGKNFAAYWPKKTVGDLYHYAKDNMPPAAPGTLTAEQYRDIVAYVLSVNGYPAGQTPLPDDDAALGAQIIGDVP